MKRILIVCMLGISSMISFGQTDNLVATDGITSVLHQSNIGRITFMDRNIPLEEYTEKDFLTSLELTAQSNLNIRVFMANSITNYMHPLAPELTADELNSKGNYQFSFYVDDTLIYKENIHPGCGLRKSITTTFRVPFTDTAGGDWWSIYLFERFKNNGGEKVLTNGKHKLTVEMRPYVKMNEEEAKIGKLIASGSLTLLIKKPKITAKQMAIQHIAKNSGFELSDSKLDKKKIEKLNSEILQNSFKAITSIVVIKDGKLLLEEYFNTAERTSLHDTRSVGKSFASILMGIAINDGFIKDENQVLSSFYDFKKFQNPSIQKEKVSLKDLLTMSSAFDGSDQNSDSPGNEENMYPTADWVKFALDLPMDSLKSNGKQWDYFTAGVVLLGDILDKSTPNGLEKYAEEKLFKPLEIKSYQWQYTPQKVVNTAGGLQMTSLGFAKIGQLYKNKGLWNNQQIIPAEWVSKTLTRQMPIPERENEFYGYLFWNKTYTVNDKNYETFYCAGNGGNKIFVFKDLPITIVITAKAYNKPYAHSQVDRMMEDYILPAILK
ncbi:MAG: beta-lactamase family protein [Flavobacterium sp. JAD_PAG50586_2]|nr:MAG: beta-lactamase family protein [Flavobacterium sp. JAD_PAG50586_2]